MATITMPSLGSIGLQGYENSPSTACQLLKDFLTYSVKKVYGYKLYEAYIKNGSSWNTAWINAKVEFCLPDTRVNSLGMVFKARYDLSYFTVSEGVVVPLNITGDGKRNMIEYLGPLYGDPWTKLVTLDVTWKELRDNDYSKLEYSFNSLLYAKGYKEKYDAMMLEQNDANDTSWFKKVLDGAKSIFNDIFNFNQQYQKEKIKSVVKEDLNADPYYRDNFTDAEKEQIAEDISTQEYLHNNEMQTRWAAQTSLVQTDYSIQWNKDRAINNARTSWGVNSVTSQENSMGENLKGTNTTQITDGGKEAPITDTTVKNIGLLTVIEGKDGTFKFSETKSGLTGEGIMVDSLIPMKSFLCVDGSVVTASYADLTNLDNIGRFKKSSTGKFLQVLKFTQSGDFSSAKADAETLSDIQYKELKALQEENNYWKKYKEEHYDIMTTNEYHKELADLEIAPVVKPTINHNIPTETSEEEEYNAMVSIFKDAFPLT